MTCKRNAGHVIITVIRNVDIAPFYRKASSIIFPRAFCCCFHSSRMSVTWCSIAIIPLSLDYPVSFLSNRQRRDFFLISPQVSGCHDSCHRASSSASVASSVSFTSLSVCVEIRLIPTPASICHFLSVSLYASTCVCLCLCFSLYLLVTFLCRVLSV